MLGVEKEVKAQSLVPGEAKGLTMRQMEDLIGHLLYQDHPEVRPPFRHGEVGNRLDLRN